MIRDKAGFEHEKCKARVLCGLTWERWQQLCAGPEGMDPNLGHDYLTERARKIAALLAAGKPIEGRPIPTAGSRIAGEFAKLHSLEQTDADALARAIDAAIVSHKRQQPVVRIRGPVLPEGVARLAKKGGKGA